MGLIATRAAGVLTRLAALAVLITLLALMLGPSQVPEATANTWDKAAHFVAFAAILWSLAVLLPQAARIQAAAMALAVGGAVELIQGATGRDASWGDWLADALGILAALLVWAAWRGFRPRRTRQTSNTR